LRRINRELDADFNLDVFRHEARWNAPKRRVEMHLVAAVAHVVRIRAIDLTVTFRAGESIWTESSYKYEADDPTRVFSKASFSVAGQWLDRDWPFAESLLIAE
ncbi:MAG TPA: L-histidine N(alpha)-methyltransferase, partial [Candidatus Binatia bacterium]|nr:L-histidine N(alpha)-methyltransferase [Candidatus Binatia bacterium]